LFLHCFPINSIKQDIKLFIRYELYRNYTTSNNGSNTLLSSYIAGLIEGDGTIHVPKTERSSKGNLNYPSIQIAFHLKDLPLALLIQKVKKKKKKFFLFFKTVLRQFLLYIYNQKLGDSPSPSIFDGT
jgi:hypothetical protein